MNQVLRLRFLITALLATFIVAVGAACTTEVEVVKEVVKEVPVEVIKEVPVERVVYEEVIKPEPVEIPVIVQVPVPTDPKDLPRMEDLKKSDIKPIAALGGLNQ